MQDNNTNWIKLYRKLLDNEVVRDATALQIFIWLLLSVDKKTGKYTTGRFVAADVLNMKPRTFHKALTERLQKKYNLVTLSSDNKKTVISILNWHNYQHNGDSSGDNKVTTKGQQSDTKQEYRLKNIYISNEEFIFSYFGDLKEDNQKIVDIATEFDIRPKDVVFCIRDMLSKSSEKEIEIKNVKAKLNTWINNSIRWHKVATLTAKEKSEKPVKKYKSTEEFWLKEEGIKIISGRSHETKV